MSSRTEVDLRRDGRRATITLRTAEGLNVLSPDVLDDLAEAIGRLDEEVWSVVVRAEGKVFVAGADIKQMKSFDRAQALAMARKGHEVFDALASLPALTVAAIQGAALGGGCELVLACDFRLAVADAPIGLPETTLGLIPGWGGTRRLPALVGLAAARRLIFSGAPIPAKEALELGLVDAVFADTAALESGVEEWLGRFTRGGPRAIARAKRALAGGNEPELFAECFTDGEAREGLTAFVEKRKAAWMEQKR